MGLYGGSDAVESLSKKKIEREGLRGFQRELLVWKLKLLTKGNGDGRKGSNGLAGD